MIGFVVWTIVVTGNRDVPDPVQILAVLAVIFAARLAVSEHHDGAAFTASAVAIAAVDRLDLHQPVSQRDGLEHQQRLQPDRQQLRVGLATR